MVFTTNQAKHFYVLSDKNTIAVKETADQKGIYFNYEGPGGRLRSDLIKKDKVQYAKFTEASDMIRTLKEVSISLDPEVNEGNPIIGQDYIVTINFRNYFGPDETHTYIKQAAVRAFDTDASTFYKKLAISLVRNFARDIVKPIDVYLVNDGVVHTKVDEKATIESLNGTYAKIVLIEKEQPWTLGIEESTPINFEVTLSPVTFEGNERIWGKVQKSVVSEKMKLDGIQGYITNSKKIADMEYFYAKERGDQYGNIGWPNVVKTTYVTNPELASGYDVIDIHYSYVGANESVQMSEKDVTIAAPAGTLNTLKSELESKGIEFA